MPGVRLGLHERECLALGLARGLSCRAIALELGRPASTISREVRRRGGASCYRGIQAHEAAQRLARRPKVRRLLANRRLARAVEAGLRCRWSPQQIAHRLAVDFVQDPTMRVSHETIYQALYVQGRGGLRKELLQELRSGRTYRHPKGPNPGRGKRGTLKEMVLIAERPAEAEDRAVPGHWEGDLLIGPQSQIATLVERSTRLVMLVKLSDRSALTVRKALEKKIRTLPDALRRSLTWDRGREMAQHREFTMATDVPVYFCDPHAPWQRGTNENTNRLLRQYMPKRTPLGHLTSRDLNKIADELNGRPRQTLGWRTPAERFAALVQ